MKGKSRRLCLVCFLGIIMLLQLAACTPVPELKSWEHSEAVPDRHQAEQEPERKIETAKIEHISVGKYAYETLSEREKQSYDEILFSILNHQEKISLSHADIESMRRAYTAVCADYGGLFWVDGYVFTQYMKGEELVGLDFSPNYTMEEETRREVQQQIDEIVEQWLGGISINDTDYDKVKYVYEMLSTNTEYTEGAKNSQNIISVFLNRQTVCQGYACAVQYLLEQLGIEAVIVSGTALGDSHAWNLLKMDGDYYYMDVTWGRGKYAGEDGTEHFFIDYKYMAMTTDEMQLNHIPDGELQLPQCNAVQNNYYRKEEKFMEAWNPEQIGNMMSQAWWEQNMLTLHFADEALYQQAVSYFIDEGGFAEYCRGITEMNYMIDPSWKEISFCFMK